MTKQKVLPRACYTLEFKQEGVPLVKGVQTIAGGPGTRVGVNLNALPRRRRNNAGNSKRSRADIQNGRNPGRCSDTTSGTID